MERFRFSIMRDGRFDGVVEIEAQDLREACTKMAMRAGQARVAGQIVESNDGTTRWVPQRTLES